MTQIIESCFQPSTRKIKKQIKSARFQEFLQGSATELKRNLIKLSEQSYCITFTSRTYQSKIKYFTILDMHDSYTNIKIIPLDTEGNVIRSRQNFNKNGWIRKHINENKNKFLKVNPLTGEVFFMYSCFVPEKFKLSQFWNDVIQKIAQIQREMPQLLSKIINLEGKQKYAGAVQQQIETNKLVMTIKLAEMLKQNMKLQQQINNVTNNPQLLDPHHHQLTQGYKQKHLTIKYSSTPRHLENSLPSKPILQQITRDYLFHARLLQQNSLRTTGKSNLTSLTLTKEDEERLRSKIRYMGYREEIRFKVEQFNREIFIMVKKEDEETVKKVKKLLRELGSEVEYLFLDNFLEQSVFDDIIMTLALKEVPLGDYLWKNFQTISYQTRFRILIQAFNSVTTLWSKNKISFQSLNIHSFTVSKTLQVKMKKLEYAKYIHPSRLQSEQAIVITNQRKQIMKQFSNIYFDIFFNKRGISIRAQKLRIKQQPQYRKEDLIFESLNQLTKLYYPNNLFTLIIGLNYFFIEMYWRNLEKLEDFNDVFDGSGYGRWREESNPVQIRSFQRIEQAKQGGPRVDLVLAMCIQFLEQHEERFGQVGGEV